MKSILKYLLMWMCVVTVGFAQNKIDNINESFHLQKGWRISYSDTVGNRKDFAELNYNDSDWEKLDLPKSGFQFELDKSAYVWFRNKFWVDDTLKGKTLAIYMGKFPNAMEIYVNGSVIGSMGTMPPEEFNANPNIAKGFIIPSGLINYNGWNVIAYKGYCERVYGDLKDPSIMENGRMQNLALFEYFFNSVVPTLVIILSFNVAIYFIIMFLRQRKQLFFLYIAIACCCMSIYYTQLVFEIFPLGNLLTLKFSIASLYFAVTFYSFFFQTFYKVHEHRLVKIAILAITSILAIVIFTSKDIQSMEFLNDKIIQLVWVSPLMFYMLFLCIYGIIKGNKYARILVFGIGSAILMGLRDIAFASLGLQPQFWMSSQGMTLFILAIFITFANYSVDNQKESEKKSIELAKKNETLKSIFQNLKNIGDKVSDSGGLLDKSISEATSVVEEMVRSNESIMNGVKNQVQTVEKNTAMIEEIISSFHRIVDAVEQQSQFVEKSSKAIENILSSIESIYSTSKQASEISGQLSKVAESGKDSVTQSTMTIESIAEASSNVKDIVNTISEIAEQTDMLAMNAAIQASHAGEFGKGFAIVASEVRNLAIDSAASSDKIMAQIQTMSEKISSGVDFFDKFRQDLMNILNGIKETVSLIERIASFSQQQSAATEEVTEAIQTLVMATQDVKNNALAQQSANKDIKNSLSELKKVANDIELSSREQEIGGKEILNTVERIKSISSDNQQILSELNQLIRVLDENIAG